MPLMKRFPALDRVREQSGSMTLTANDEGYFDDHYDNMPDCDDGNISDGSILSEPPAMKTAIPAVPPRSQLRLSRNLENLMIDLASFNKVGPAEKLDEQAVESDPYASYVSSEEDGSVSADDIDESRIELESGGSSSRASSRHSHEDVARIVSFMFVGKPQLVDIIPHSSVKRRSIDHIKETRHRPSPLRLALKSHRFSSVSTRASSSNRSTTSLSLHEEQTHSTTNSNINSTDNSSVSDRSTKGSSANSSKVSSVGITDKHAFLQSDPFPTRESHEVEVPLSPTEATPQTPSWKGSLKGVSRSLSAAARKRPSMLKLSLAYTPGSSKQTPTTPSFEIPISASSPGPVRPSQDQTPVSYQDIMKSVIKGPPPPPTPETPKSKMKMGSNMLGLNRKKSVKAVMQNWHIPF